MRAISPENALQSWPYSARKAATSASMQGGVGIGGEGAQGFGDGIGGPLVVRRGADVRQGRAVGVAQHLDMAGVASHGR